MCVHFFFQLWSFENYTSKFRSILRHKFRAPLSFSLHSSSPTSKLLCMASYGGELLLDSSSPCSGVFSQLFFFSLKWRLLSNVLLLLEVASPLYSSSSSPLLSLKFKKQRTPLMKKIQGLQASHRSYITTPLKFNWIGVFPIQLNLFLNTHIKYSHELSEYLMCVLVNKFN